MKQNAVFAQCESSVVREKRFRVESAGATEDSVRCQEGVKTFAPGDCVSAERIDIISLFEHR